MLQLEAVTKSYSISGRERVVLHDVSLSIGRGETVSIIGRSGAGKTTLARICGGLEDATSGSVRLDDENVTEAAQIAFMFQNYSQSLFPWLSVLSNVRLGAPNDESRTRAEQALERVGLLHTARLRPTQLSAGMQQRVALARALSSRAVGLILDEPFASLDYLSRLELETRLREIVHAERLITLHVTHDLESAIFLSDRVLALRHGRVAGVVEINLPERSDPVLSRGTPQFAACRQALWQLLETDEGSPDATRTH